MLLEIEREAQFTVRVFAVANRSRSGVIGISRAGDSRSLDFKSKARRRRMLLNMFGI